MVWSFFRNLSEKYHEIYGRHLRQCCSGYSHQTIISILITRPLMIVRWAKYITIFSNKDGVVRNGRHFSCSPTTPSVPTEIHFHPVHQKLLSILGNLSPGWNENHIGFYCRVVKRFIKCSSQIYCEICFYPKNTSWTTLTHGGTSSSILRVAIHTVGWLTATRGEGKPQKFSRLILTFGVKTSPSIFSLSSLPPSKIIQSFLRSSKKSSFIRMNRNGIMASCSCLVV